MKTEHTTQYPKIQLSKAKNSIMSAEFTKHETVAVVDAAKIVRADLNEKGDEKVKMTKEEKKAAAAAKKAAAAAKKAAAELEKKKKAEERAAKKAAAELEKQKKAEERAAKKAAAELEKQKKAEERAAKKAAKQEKTQQKQGITVPSSLQIELGKITEVYTEAQKSEELQVEQEVETPENKENSQNPAIQAAESSAKKVPSDADVAQVYSPPYHVDTDNEAESESAAAHSEDAASDDDSVECDFTAVMEKLQKMKAIILTTRENLKQLEACYADVANVLGADATL